MKKKRHHSERELSPEVRGAEEKGFSLKKESKVLALGTIFYVGALILKLPLYLELAFYILSYSIIARNVVWKAIRNIYRGSVFDENLLLTVATLGAFAIGEFPEAVAVILFFKMGELLQDMAVDRSRRSIKSLVEIRADYANLQIDGKTKKVDPNEIRVGDIIVVKPGERVPLDGIITDGTSMVDTSSLTGESAPRKLKPGDEILSRGNFL